MALEGQTCPSPSPSELERRTVHDGGADLCTQNTPTENRNITVIPQLDSPSRRWDPSSGASDNPSRRWDAEAAWPPVRPQQLTRSNGRDGCDDAFFAFHYTEEESIAGVVRLQATLRTARRVAGMPRHRSVREPSSGASDNPLRRLGCLATRLKLLVESLNLRPAGWAAETEDAEDAASQCGLHIHGTGSCSSSAARGALTRGRCSGRASILHTTDDHMSGTATRRPRASPARRTRIGSICAASNAPSGSDEG